MKDLEQFLIQQINKTKKVGRVNLAFERPYRSLSYVHMVHKRGNVMMYHMNMPINKATLIQKVKESGGMLRATKDSPHPVQYVFN